jgi:hypothetical protein
VRDARGAYYKCSIYIYIYICEGPENWARCRVGVDPRPRECITRVYISMWAEMRSGPINVIEALAKIEKPGAPPLWPESYFPSTSPVLFPYCFSLPFALIPILSPSDPSKFSFLPGQRESSRLMAFCTAIDVLGPWDSSRELLTFILLFIFI